MSGQVELSENEVLKTVLEKQEAEAPVAKPTVEHDDAPLEHLKSKHDDSVLESMKRSQEERETPAG